MNLFDLVIVGLLIAGLIVGYRRGFIRQTVRFVGVVISLYIAYHYLSDAEPFVRRYIPYLFSAKEAEWVWLAVFNIETVYYYTLTFILLFSVARLAFSLVARVLEAISRLPGLNIANRSLGMLMGLLKMALLIVIVSHLLYLLPWEAGQALVLDSKFGLWVMHHSPLADELLS